MKYAKRARHKPGRWPEEVHVVIACSIAVVLIIGAMIGIGKLAGPLDAQQPAAARTLVVR